MGKSIKNSEMKQSKEIKSQTASEIKRILSTSKLATCLMLLGIGMMVYGIWRGELAIVWQKAIQICLECIGIG